MSSCTSTNKVQRIFCINLSLNENYDNFCIDIIKQSFRDMFLTFKEYFSMLDPKKEMPKTTKPALQAVR